jgi:GntR family transcriptional repressor for pyruvate dehydrogenase complex
MDLQKEILKGEYPPESRFPSERELCLRYDVSRSTVREAVGRLSQLGLVETRPQSGTYVSNYQAGASLDLLVHIMQNSETIDSDVLLSLLEFRKLVEVHAARAAARGADSEALMRMRDIVDQESEARDDPAAMAECDYRLHYLVINLSGNFILQLVFNSWKPMYRYYTDFFFRLPGAIEVTAEQHRSLLAAFAARDGEEAAAVMEAALVYGENRIRDALGIAGKRRDVVLNNIPPVSPLA